MNKTFRKVSVLCTLAMSLCTVFLTLSCKGSDKKADTVAASDSGIDAKLAAEIEGLGNVFDGAIKTCGVCEDESDEEMELVDFDTVIDDEDGTEIPVAYFSYKGEIFQMMDIDADGCFDIAVFDSDDDGDVSEDEIVDISDQNITIDDIAEMAGVDGDDDDYYAESEYEEDDEESIVERTSREMGTPSRQRREAVEEEDLPDYVNNARVKAFRKK